MNVREIENADLWSAIRGLSLTRKTNAELAEIESVHNGKTEFASRVIVEACRQVRAAALNRKAEER